MTVLKDVDVDMVTAIAARTSYVVGTNLFPDEIPPAGGSISQVAIGVKQISAPPSTRYINGNSASKELHRDVLFVVTARGDPRDPKTARDAIVDVIEALHDAPPTGYLNVVMNGAPYHIPRTDGDLDVPYYTVDGYATYQEA